MRIECPELLFTHIETEEDDIKSLQSIAWESIKNSDIDTRKDLLNNIFLVGGNTMYKGIHEKFKLELEKLAPSGTQVYVRSSDDPL